MKYPKYYNGKLFEKGARVYDIGINVLTFGLDNKLKEELLEYVPRNSKNILDLFCGTGTLALMLYHGFKSNIVGVDLSEKMLEVAREKARKEGANIEFLVRDAEHTGLKKDFFDAVFLTFGLHEIPPQNRINVIEEVYRLLRKKGRFVLLDFNSYDRIGIIQRMYYGLIFKLFEEYADSFVRTDFNKLLEQYKFRVIETKEVVARFLQVIVAEKV